MALVGRAHPHRGGSGLSADDARLNDRNTTRAIVDQIVSDHGLLHALKIRKIEPGFDINPGPGNSYLLDVHQLPG